MNRLILLASFLTASLLGGQWLDYPGGQGPGRGKHIVLVGGDEEYRSEEALPQLAKILSLHHGFHCTVLFAIDRKDGTINPDQNDNIPGLEALDKADLMILFTRFRDLPDEQMKHVVDYVNSGRPIVAMRTATHAFLLKTSATYKRYSYNSKEWDGGFGRQILGETWINHHGRHAIESTRGIFAPGQERHPILRGIRNGEIWAPSDVYTTKQPLFGDSVPLVLGQVLTGMKPDDPALPGPKNEPMMPVAWTKSYVSESGKRGRVFTTTMGAANDLQNEALRRLVVNGCYWALGLEKKLPAKSNVELVGDYRPSPFKFGGFVKGIKPSDLESK
ncbi:ThuA domain-containing protein [Paludibaculum fermentans]|uniref:ThuA domain-containing protein n=1 Tax=Paludibaculum fermentans TaxID=1473598 RepID=UPI003EB6EE9B